MGQAAHRYFIFETAAGFCGIAWNDVGITRFQLPTRAAEASERLLLKRLPSAESAQPTPEIREAVGAVQRYFDGKEVDFTGFAVDLEGQDELFRRIYAATRALRWGQTTTYGALAKSWAPGRRRRVMSGRPWPRTRFP